MPVFLFTDIEGSSRLWEEHTAEMGEVISRHDAILRQAIEASGGRITKHTGDGVTAAFEDGEPISCAIEAQRCFAAEAWGGIGELRIRAGLHAGEAEFRASAGTADGDYFGPPVNATARVMSAAWGGQVLLTPEVTDATPLPSGAALRDLGQHLLKNVSAPQQLYQLDHPQLPWHEFPPPRTLSGQSVRRAVEEEGSQLAALEPGGIAVGLLTAVLLPALQGDLDPESGALEGNLGVLGELGAATLRSFITEFAGRLPARQRAGQTAGVGEIRALLGEALLAQWQAGGETAAALRADTGRLLQAVHAVEVALTTATGKIKEALAGGLGDLGTQFGEFRWMLAGVQDTLAELRARQALQLALQREQLELQRQQLVKTNLILHRQRVGAPLAELTVAGEVDEEPPADVPCPYKGLAAFEAEDTKFFFGREELVAELTARLAGTRFLAVVGPSGSGKSSLVRAGLLPAVWGDALPGSRDWQTLVLTPGTHPLEELAVRIALLNGYTAGSLLREMEQDPRGLHLAIKQALVEKAEGVQLLLIVDQFEEVFALCRDEGERQRFIEALLYAVGSEEGRTVVVPTIRADFYGRCADYPALAASLADSVLVGPLDEGGLRQAIERPAERVGLRLEPGLTDTIVADVAGEPGALPLLSHALVETWERRRGRTLTLSGYAESGGVAGAIAQTADTVFAQFSPQEQTVARNIFLRLTELGEEGTQDTRRRVAPRELVRTAEEGPMVEAVLKTLADARLITTGEKTVEVAHEALIREWPLLRGWLEEDREGLRTHRHLTEAALEWERLGREPGELYRGARLATAGEWIAQHADEPNPLEREFLEASQELARARERQRQRRRRQVIMGLAGGLVVAIALALLAGQQWRRATAEERKAVGQANARATEVAVRSTAVVDSLEAKATAEAESVRAERETRLATAREWAASAISTLAVDPELSVLLALQAVSATSSEDGTVTREAENALHQAILQSRVRRTLVGHTDMVQDVAYSPDGTRLATSSWDGTAKVWDALSGEELLTLEGHSGWVYSVAFSPDGARIATGGRDGTVKIWDASALLDTDLEPPVAAAGQELMTLSGHGDRVWHTTFSPDGVRIATSSGDGTARVWDSASGEELLRLKGEEVFTGIAFDPEGKLLAVGTEDGMLKVWDLEESLAAGEGQEVLTIAAHDPYVDAAAFSPDGRRIATGGSDSTAKVWDASSGEQLLTLAGHTSEIWDIHFSPDGTRLATSSPDGTAKVWDAATGEELLTLAGHKERVISVAFSPDGTHLATAARDQTAKLWDITPSREWLTLEPPGDLGDIAYSPDGTRLAIVGEGATIWDASSGEALLALDGHSDWIGCAQFSPDGTRLATASDDGTAKVWDAASGDELHTLSGHTGWVNHLAFSPDGLRLATVGEDGTARIWDIASGKELVSIAGDEGGIWGVSFSPDGAKLATGGQDETAKVWDAATGEQLLALSGHAATLAQAVFSPDGTRLATCGWDNTIKLWDALSGEELLTLTGHRAAVWGLAFSPDGTRLATGSADSTAKLWDAITGEELLSLTGHTGEITNLAFSPDGTRLATCSYDGTARVYILPIGELVELAKSRVTRALTDEECRRYLHMEACPAAP
ncbi:MAG: adenylate/guanylate cyclase domain-containing protein [Anaerolineae bacterium]|jgi:WD40 repeat protein/class 3 adenylate cyclase